tara:strand:- start:83 stop:793 length:711 start_codon:yes stop_codon:yes gene_type:complete
MQSKKDYDGPLYAPWSSVVKGRRQRNKKLLIVTGPQGSGNHLFARVFSQHPDVIGWEKLKTNYWVPSDEEPFAEYWVNPDLLDFPEGDYFLANVSVPFFYDGVRQTPKISQVCHQALHLGVQPIVAIITRDQNINAVQQKRVGGEVTLPTAMEYYKHIINDEWIETHFLSHECFFLWGENYIKYVAEMINFPVTTKGIDQYITSDANGKYVSAIDHHWLDDTIREGRKPFKQRRAE